MNTTMPFPERIRPLMALRLVAFILSTAVLVGCAAGPDFKPPAPPAVQNYTSAELPARTASAPEALGGSQRFVPQAPIGSAWWQQFGSPKLNSLIEQALHSSPTLEAAQAALRQAQEFYNAQAGSSLYPQINAQLGAQRQTINLAGMGFNAAGGNLRTFSLYNTSVGASYNFDLAGGNRRELEALAAQTDYQRFQLEGARLTVVANIVTTTITQAKLAEQLAASEQILAAQVEQLNIAHQRQVLGNASEADVMSLQTQVEQTRANLVPLRNQLQQANHLLAVLLGQPPGETAMPQFTLAEFILPVELPLRVPSELVHQRPDIQAAEALLHVASAQYGVSLSRLYPQLTLSASMGSEALTSASLFGPGSIVWGLGAQIAQPLFNAGLRPGARAAEAGFNAAAANYRQTVLQALRNVADVLRALDNDAQALQAQSSADSSAQRSLELTQQQYRLGAASYLQLLIAQQQAQQTRISLTAAQAQRLADTAALYQAMGGGQH